MLKYTRVIVLHLAILLSAPSLCYACSPYLRVYQMANSTQNICVSSIHDNKLFEVSVHHNSSGGFCETEEWTVTQTTWKLYDLTSSNPLQIDESYLVETFEEDTNVLEIASSSDVLEDYAIYGIVVNGTVEGLETTFQITNYIVNGCDQVTSMNNCNSIKKTLGLDGKDFENLLTCEDSQYSTGFLIAVDGGFSEWTAFGSCSVSCGTGSQSRSRDCTNPVPQYGGSDCVGASTETQYCNTNPCPVDGGFTEWTAFGSCSVSCGTGSQSRSRDCTNPVPQYGGSDCVGASTETQYCNTNPCPVDGGFSEWTAFGSCSVSCGTGSQSRSRDCTNPVPQYGGNDCVGASTETQYCNTNPCPVDGGFTEWTAFGSCSVSCGTGSQSRSRDCTNPVPQYGGSDCVGDSRETQDCNTNPCPVDGGFTEWTAFGSCSVSCGTGSQSRSRDCTNPVPQYGGSDCVGASTEKQDCNTNPCPGEQQEAFMVVDGGFTVWTAWGSCTVTCGTGSQSRSRDCTNPAPQNGGSDCVGDSIETQECNTNFCPIDGGFTEWTAFGSCSVSCGTGSQSRSRDCTNPVPQYGGSDCVGDSTEKQDCNTNPCPAETSTATAVISTTEEQKPVMVSYEVQISCISNCVSLVNPQQNIEFLMTCVECGSGVVEYNWRTASCVSNDLSSCTQAIRTYPANSQSPYFSYMPPQEELQTQAAVLLEAIFEDGTADASYIWTYSPVPVAGSCDISPLTGYALLTEFSIACQGFSVSGDQTLKYTFKTSEEDSLNKALSVYTGEASSVTNIKLQTGKESSNYTLFVLVQATVNSGAAVHVSHTVQVMPPSHADNGTNVADIVKNFINVGNETGDDIVGSLFQSGNQDGAVQLIGAISSTINADKEPGDADKNQERTELRTALVQSLGKVNVSSFEIVQSLTTVLNDATEERDELTEEAQTKAADLYDNLAETLSDKGDQTTKAEITETGSAILSGVTKILDIKTDTGQRQQTQNTTQSDSAETMEKVKNVSMKVLNTVEKVTSTLLSRQVVGQNATVLHTGTMTVSLQRLSKGSMKGKTLHAADSVESSPANFKFPDSLPSFVDESEVGAQVLHMQKNPYIWDVTASDVSSGVLAVDFKDSSNSPIPMNNLTEPLRVSFMNNDARQQSNASLYLHLIKSDGNLTFNVSKQNLMTFNFTTVPDKTTSLQVTPLINISSLIMFISEGNKPNHSETTEFGFAYPQDINKQSNYTLANLEKNAPNNTEILFFSFKNDSTNYTGAIYIGLTVDLDDTEVQSSLQELDPECLGNNATVHCVTDIEIPLQLETMSLGCLFWDKNLQQWSSQGCEVSPFTTRESLECLCSHMTAFAGGVFVMPNFVDPLGDAALFLTFFENPIVVTTVIIVWIVYFFLLHWARRSDWNDRERFLSENIIRVSNNLDLDEMLHYASGSKLFPTVGIISCPDNDPTHKYMYLLCVATGWWKDAGTTANVFYYFKGSLGESARRCLSCSTRQCFQTGYEDWFVVTTNRSFGDLQEVMVWHDNSGPSPHWYLTQLYVQDMQTNQSWTFILNDWLAVDRGATLQTSTTIPALTVDDLKHQKKHNFLLKSSRDLRDGHLWISIFSKPVQSSFTRPQRSTCALSLLLCTMLTNIMFYGIPTNEPEDQLAGVQISLTTIVIGIESGLIMFPINMLILQMFLRIKSKPKVDHIQKKSSTSKGNLHNKTQSKEAVDGQDISTGDIKDSAADLQDSFVSLRTLEEGFELNTEMKIGTKIEEMKAEGTSKFLPWWFVYIAWTIVLISCLISSYFVMLYGLKYGYTKSVGWLVSFLTGFTQSAFITQPIKVVALAMVFTLIFKKSVPFEDFGPAIQLNQDEEYLGQATSIPETHIPYSEPLSSTRIEQIKDRLKMEWLMNATIRDIVLYIIYLIVVLLVVHGHRNTRNSYLGTLALEDVLVNPGCINLNKCFFLQKADNVERFYKYLHEVVQPNLADMTVADHDFATPGSNHFLVGPYRLRQLRIAKDSCSPSSDWIFQKFDFAFECSRSYWIGDEDIVHYNTSWAEPVSGTPGDMTQWIHQSSWDLKTMPITGKHATYSGGGYVLQMPSDPGLHEDIFEELWNTDWIDERTRAVFIEFTLYNPNADLFSILMILFEFTNIGGVFPSHQIFTTKLYHNSSDFGTVLLVSECFFLCFNLVFAYVEIKRYRKIGRREYLTDFWNYIEILQLCLAYSVIGLFFQRAVSVSSILDEYRNSLSTEFVNFYTALFWDKTLGYVMAFLVCLVSMKFIKLLKFNKRSHMVGDTLSQSKEAFLSFIIMVLVFFMGFAHFGLLVFGSVLYEYRELFTSLMTVFNFALGVSDLPGLQSADRILGPLFFVLFVFLAQFCFLTMFIAILNVGIIEANEIYRKRKNKFELIEFMVSKVKLLTGTK